MRNLWRAFFLFWQRVFGRLGRAIGRHPLLFLAGSLLFVVLCSLGFLKASFVNNIDELWVPSTSATVKNANNFNAGFATDPFSRLERIMVVPKNPDVDMLQTKVLEQVFELRDQLFNFTVAARPGDAQDANGRAGLQQMCALMYNTNSCIYFDPLGYWKDNVTLMQSRTPEELHSDVNQLLLSGNIPVEQRMVLGCDVKVPSGLFAGDMVVRSVGALIFTIFVDRSRVAKATIEQWETDMLTLLDNANYPDIVGYASTGVSISQEISKQSGGDVTLLILVYVLMSLYMVVALTTFNPFRTHVLLGLGAVATVLAGVIASLGFTALFWQFNPLTIQVLPFLMLSIGMDSVFILFTHFHISIRSLPLGRPSSLRADLALAMEDALYRQGASIALTALTKAVAFLGPVIVLRIPALEQFCIVVAISIGFEAILALCAFCPILIFDAMREFSHRADVLPCFKVPVVEADPSESEKAGDAGPATSASAAKAGAEDDGTETSRGGVLAEAQASETTEGAAEGAGGAGLARDGLEGEEALQVMTAPQVMQVSGRGGGAGAESEGEAADESEQEPTKVAVEDGEDPGEDGAERPKRRGLLGCCGGATSALRQRRRGPQKKRESRYPLLDTSREMERQQKTVLGRFLLNFYVPKVLASAWGQLAVYLIFGGLLTVGIYGVATIGETLEIRSLITEGTQLYNYLGYEDQCNTHIGPPFYLVTNNMDYSLNTTSANVKALIKTFEESPYVEPPVYNWYTDFTDRFLPYSNWSSLLDAQGWPVSRGVFYAALDEFLASFAGAGYTGDLRIQRDVRNRIINIEESRMQSFYAPLNATADYVHAMQDSRQRAAAIPAVPAYTQSYFYVFYEQFLSIVQQYYMMLALTVLAIFVVTLIFMGLKTAFVVSVLVLMIHIEMLGITSFVGVSLNAVSAVNAVAIMGLADEYVNYIMRAFELEDGTPQERVKSALLQYFRPISNAAISTIIGIIPVAFAKSALYKVYYFRMFFTATILSWLTGLVFLPVLLLSTHGEGLGAIVWSWITCKACRRRKAKEVTTSEPPEESI